MQAVVSFRHEIKKNCAEQILRETSKEIYNKLLFNNHYSFPRRNQSLSFRNRARPDHDQASQKESRQSIDQVHLLCAAQQVVLR